MGFAIPVDHWVKIGYLNLARELKRTMKHEVDSDTNSS